MHGTQHSIHHSRFIPTRDVEVAAREGGVPREELEQGRQVVVRRLHVVRIVVARGVGVRETDAGWGLQRRTHMGDGREKDDKNKVDGGR